PLLPSLHSFPTRRSSDLTSRFIHRHLLCLHGFGHGRTAVNVCHGKTVCVPHHVATGKVLGAPWGRKAAVHSITLSARTRIDSGTDRKSTRLNSSHVAISY